MSHHIADRFAELRDASGLSYNQLLRQLYDLLGGYAPTSVEGVRIYHHPDTFPRRPDPVLLAALLEVYKVTPAEVSDELAIDLTRVRRLLDRNAWLAAAA